MSFSPLWNEWHIKELIGKGTFGAVYKAEKTEYGNHYYSAIKHISIPPANVTKESLAADGIATDERSFSMYCDNLRDQIIKEINVCYTLRGNTNIVSYEDHCIIPKKDGTGYDVFIRMELLTGLTSYMVKNPLKEKDVIRLGTELCDALSVLEKNRMIHRDIKPANIFVNSNGVFKLGDFGESKVLSNSTMGMTIRGTYNYMSPEISRGESANITADIYSLGLVLYRLLNGNRAPFLPVNNQPVSSAASENANVKRLKGEPLLPPAYCSNPALSDVILKACAYRKEDRWQSPAQMKQALEAVLYGKNVQSVQYQPQGTMTNQAPPPVYPSRPQGTMTNQAPPMYPSQPQMPAPAYPQSKKSKKGLIIGISIAAAVLIAVVIIIIAVSSDNSNSSNSNSNSNLVGTWKCVPESGYTLSNYAETMILYPDGSGQYYMKKYSYSSYELYTSFTWSSSGDSLYITCNGENVTMTVSNGKIYNPNQSASHYEKASSSTSVPS